MAELDNDPLAQAGQMPLLNKNGILTVVGIVAALWLIALVAGSTWVTVAVGVVTVAIAGGMVWLFRLARRQRQVLSLLQSAGSSADARRQAVAALAAQDKGGKDVMSRLARAQLEAQDDPDKAIATLEAIELGKVQAASADEVRTVLGQLYLLRNRVRDARNLADQIKLANAGNAQSRAMMTAIVAEAWARTGKHEAALDILADVKRDSVEPQLGVMLAYAHIFAFFAAHKKDKVKKEMALLMRTDVNLLGRFVAPGQGAHPELQKLAREVLQTHPDMRKMARQQAHHPAMRRR